MMYGQEDARTNGERMKRQILLTLCVFAALLAVTGVLFALRLQIPSVAAGMVLGAAMIFLIDLRVMPLVRYGRLLDHIFTGLRRETTGILQEINTQDRVLAEGNWFYELTLVLEDCGANDENRRLFYFDCAKPLPENLIGKRVVLSSYEKTVVGLCAAEDAAHA